MTKAELEDRVAELEQEVVNYKTSLSFMTRLANTLFSQIGWTLSIARRADPQSTGILVAAGAEQLYRNLIPEQRTMVDSWELHFTEQYPEVTVPVASDDKSALAQVLRVNLM